MYIKDGRLMDIEGNAPLELRKVNATDIQITNFLNDRVKPIREIVSKANAQIEAIQSDAYLSDHGKEEKIKSICLDATGKVSKINDKAEKIYSNYLSELSRRLEVKEPVGTGDKVLDFLEQQELRKELSSLSEKEVLKIYRSASDSGEDERLIAAIENNPLNSISPLVSADKIEKEKQKRLVRDNPDVFAEINLVQAMDSISQKAADTVKQAILNTGYTDKDT